MESLFRLMLVRPGVTQDPDHPSIDLAQDSPYQRALAEAVRAGQGREGVDEVSADYAASAEFLGDPQANPYHEQLRDLVARLDAVSTAGELRAAVTAAFGSSPADLVTGEAFRRAHTRLRDSLMAIKLLQRLHSRPIAELSDQLRTVEVIVRAAADENFPGQDCELRRYRRRSLQLPLRLGLKSRLSTREAEAELRERRKEHVAVRAARVDDLLAEHERLRVAIGELSALEQRHFRVSTQADSGVVQPPAELGLTKALTEASAYTESVRAAHLRKLGSGGVINAAAAEEPELTNAIQKLAQSLLVSGTPVVTGRGEFKSVELPAIGFVVKPDAAQQLSGTTRTLLADRGIEVDKVPLDRVTERLQRDLATTVSGLERLAGHPVKHSFVRVGDALVSVQTPITTGWGAIGTGGVVPIPHLPLDGRVPHTVGDVAPAGVADLLVVRQQLTGYEGADIAHVENVLRGERKAREHVLRKETELTTVREVEVSKTEERELETTDRFEMTRETSQTIKEDIALKAGLNVSGKYGPAVEFSASAEGSFSRTKEEATKSAAKFSQDVTERSSRKIAERVLERTTLRVTTETTEKNTHELDNVAGEGHISGAYQWVTKVYQAQMYNYGLRAMFDFMVPEPASFLIEAMRQAHASTLSLTKPPEFTLTPAQVNESNYQYWVKQCGATDVTPPPELYRTKSQDFKAGGGDEKTSYNHAGQIAIDDGYRAVYGSVGAVRNVWDVDKATVDLVLGRRTHRMENGDWLWTTTLDDERDSIPFAIDTFRCSQVAVAIEVKTQRTDRAMDKWRLETHGKLATAHALLVADYEEKLAALQLTAGVVIRGRNPAADLVAIQSELKKNCVSILTDQHFDLFDAIDTSPVNGLPEIDVFEAAGEGAYVRFFEHAFEWEHMTWVNYPYFWGRKNQWDERMSFEDPDPVFSEFLQSGCCRVSVPARPGFEGAIDHFLTFGEIWNGGPLPAISSPLYLPIADEIAERLDRPGDEFPQGEPWTVRIPTNLVRLRPDDQLPSWEQNGDGEWVEV